MDYSDDLSNLDQATQAETGGHPVATNDDLQRLTRDVLMAWQGAHGRTDGTAGFLVRSDSFTILAENVFTQAERMLVKHDMEQNTLKAYVECLGNQVCAEVSPRVEKTLDQRVISVHVNADLPGGRMIFFFELAPRRSADQSQDPGRMGIDE